MTTLTQTQQAAAWAASFRLEDAPRDVVELSRLQIANILAAILAGSRSAAGQSAFRALSATRSPGPCTLVPHGSSAALWDALWLHAVYANALELDDFHFRGHLGPAVVVVPLALAEVGGLDGRAVLRAQIIANELGGRLGWAIHGEIRHGHQRSYLLRFAAAAAAASLLGLDATRFARALSIAMTQPEMPLHPGEFSPDTKVLSAASSVVEGTRAAYLANEGIDAALDILENPAGFYRQFTLQREVASPFVQLGEAWSTHALSFKRYSACAYASGAVDAALAVRSDPDYATGAVERIEVASSLPALVMERLAEPHDRGRLTPVNVQFSILRCVAAALTLGDLRGYHFRPAAFDALVPEIRRLSERATLVHDWTFTIHQLRGLDAGLKRGGTRRSADTLQFYRTFGTFRSMFGSARAIGPGDIRKLFALPADDVAYFARRWGRSLASRLRLRERGAEQAPLGDLRQLSFRMGARVTVHLSGGRRIVAERIIPTGMAGDPRRAKVVEEKFFAEGEPVLGRARAKQLWAAISDLEAMPTAGLLRIAREEVSDERAAN
jgi:2-methylcitrate dehydratase PrpD